MKRASIITSALFGLALSAAPSLAADSVKVALDSPADLNGSGSYVWAHAFTTYLNDHGMKAEEFQRGALGGDDELLDQVSQGLVEVAMAPLKSAGGLNNLIYGLYLPYFFSDLDEVDKALYDGGMLATINDGTTTKGVRVLAVDSVGLGSGIFNTKHPVNSMSDLSDLRMRALDESQIELFAAWGTTGTIVSWAEVPNALQTGVADGYINPAFVPLMFGHTDFIKYFTDAQVSPSVRIAIASEDWYEGLSDEQRKIVDDAVAAADKANRDWAKSPDRDADMDKLREAGVEVAELTKEARDEFVKASETVYKTGVLTAEQVDQWIKAKAR
jgi:TRAP-type C4-dicarboxylate transport system substrate-binding protein